MKDYLKELYKFIMTPAYIRENKLTEEEMHQIAREIVDRRENR